METNSFGQPVVLVNVTQVYGNRTIYPVNKAALRFADIAGTKTLTTHTIALIKELGFIVEVRQREV